MDNGYDVKAFLEGASGKSCGTEVLEISPEVLKIIRDYFLQVYGNSNPKFRKWALLRWWSSLFLLPMDVVIFFGILLDIRPLFLWGVLLLMLLVAVFLFTTIRLWSGISSKPWVSTLIHISQPVGGPALLLRILKPIPLGNPPSYLDGMRPAWLLRLSIVIAVPASAAFVWLWISGGVPIIPRIEASLTFVVYILAEFPMLYLAWISTKSWPGTTPLYSYYPLFVIRRDLARLIKC
jgi:hypothetical protein